MHAFPGTPAFTMPPARITPDSLMSWPDYARHRITQRSHAIAHRLARTVTLGPHVRLQFEDERTLRYQIQEMLHAERITDTDAIQQEIDHVAHLLPDGATWHATLMIQIPCAQIRKQLLPSISAAAHQVYIEAPHQPRTFASANDDLPDRHMSRPSAVHFLRFPVPDALRQSSRQHLAVSIGCAAGSYAWTRQIPLTTLASLRRDLTSASPGARHHLAAPMLCAAE